jgi:hypothetical protein
MTDLDQNGPVVSDWIGMKTDGKPLQIKGMNETD